MAKFTFGFLGCGNMGGALARAAAQALPGDRIAICDRHPEKTMDLTGCGKVDLQELRRALESYPNLELRDRTEAPIDVWAEAGEDTLEGIYFHMLRKRMEERPEEEAHIQQAAEISRRLLLGREVTL